VPDDAPGESVHQDGMRELIARMEAADGLIFASPTSVYSMTAVFKGFMERLIVYAYWPSGRHAPKFRRKDARKSAVLLASSAAPGWIGRLFLHHAEAVEDDGEDRRCQTRGHRVCRPHVTGATARAV
jgi:multimeric flavodoxin WrbA